jgi:hypothetical protein
MKPHRCPEYLDYVRSLRCCCCGAPAQSEAHHAFGPYLGGGKGIKGSDYGAVPMCARHHRDEHDGHEADPIVLLLAMAKSLVAWRWRMDTSGLSVGKPRRIAAGDIARRLVTALFGGDE